MMAEVEAGGLRLRIPTEIVIEVLYVLTSKTYGYSRRDVADQLTALLTTDGIEPEESNRCIEALAQMAEQSVPFVDALLAVRAREVDQPVATFDERDFQRLGVKRLPI